MKLAAVAITALCAIMILKNYRPELAVLAGIAAGISILAYGVKTASGAAQAANSLMNRYGLDAEGMKTVIKMIG
ncbi:MAG: hypothetical protein IJD61_01055, partial [Clostridia bacterium]|nr:hypothetical protein [Clostridia bacterium]